MAVIEIFLPFACVLLVLLLVWFMFLTDADIVLSLAEKFGRPVSRYRGKVIWITGASTGLGEAMAYELASVGAKLVLTARSKNLLHQVKTKCLEISQGKLTSEDILVLPLDITKQDEHKTSVANVLSHFGQIDVLVNNAARYQIGSIEHTSPEVEKEIFEVNFFGTVNLTKLVLKHFLERRRGHFVVISSMAGKCGIPSCATYSATKFALHGYFEALRMEHTVNRIHVTMVCPGIFSSSMYSQTVFSEKNHCEDTTYGCTQMTSERCAHLALISAVNKLYESWIGYQPFILMMWGTQYVPDINRWILTSVVFTEKRVKELNEGIWPKDMPTWKPIQEVLKKKKIM